MDAGKYQKGPLLLLAACTCGCSNALLQLKLNINLSCKFHSLMLEYNFSPDSILHLPLQYTDVHSFLQLSAASYLIAAIQPRAH